MTTNSGVMLSLFKDFRLSFYLILVYKFCIVGFLGVRLTCPVGFGHVPSHLVLGCDKMVSEPRFEGLTCTNQVLVESRGSVRRCLYLSSRGYEDC